MHGHDWKNGLKRPKGVSPLSVDPRKKRAPNRAVHSTPTKGPATTPTDALHTESARLLSLLERGYESPIGSFGVYDKRQNVFNLIVNRRFAGISQVIKICNKFEMSEGIFGP